jgi:hypothetical protein
MSWLQSLRRWAATATERRLSVQFDLSGWTLERDEDAFASWVNQVGDHLLLTRYDPGVRLYPVFPVPESLVVETDDFRDCLQDALERAGGSLVSYDAFEVSDRSAIQVIMKYTRLPPAQEEARSFLEPWYVGRLRVQTLDGNWVLIEIQCEDRNPHTTGVRGVVAYLGSQEGGVDYDDERWDADVPDHPLSRLRRHLRRCRVSLKFLDDGPAGGGAT